jgi:hypothetical protein
MNRKKTVSLTIAGAIVAFFTLSANGCDSGTTADANATDRQLKQYQSKQPIPFHDWSQYRQTLISIDDAQAHGTATTSFMFLMGVPNPIRTCPSIGYPVPSTAQLTNPGQNSGGTTISQMEPNGVYTGESSGTYVVCVVNGKPVPVYWEGDVHAEGGPAHWDKAKGQVVTDGAPTVTVKTEK